MIHFIFPPEKAENPVLKRSSEQGFLHFTYPVHASPQMKYILLSDSDPDTAYYYYFTIIMHEYQSSSKKNGILFGMLYHQQI